MSDFTPRKPDFKGDGVAVWKATTREGKIYLRVSLFGGGVTVNCYPNEDKQPTPAQVPTAPVQTF